MDSPSRIVRHMNRVYVSLTSFSIYTPTYCYNVTHPFSLLARSLLTLRKVDLNTDEKGDQWHRLTGLKSFILRYFVEWWLLEILSFCFSAACMGAIVIVLLSYDGNRTPDWPFGMTLNGFISVFSNFAKSALMLSIAEAMGQLKCE
jgi:hypothetical protein